ncbi:hypothetical protein [Streptomyces griseiscabiei]|uniref:Fibrillarin n=1 Tax=Streptomyces griseiscabiei TaxID=2993540 RepID=A0ABU4LA55_9ACTN|nr:hypothetical protein [Streptomyces griseiscabiei]MBZ3903557.1 hypothetical protein [Streptomyces griseiscabiei]MDX2912301.1 hypothetical protein [Streptomyces griseiscabiei]
MRLAHTVFGGLAAMAWLLLPTATEPAGVRPTGPPPDERLVTPVVGVRPLRPGFVEGPMVPAPPAPAAVGPRFVAATDDGATSGSAVAPDGDETSGADLVLPVAAAGTAVALAAYSLVRRRRRARLRTTPRGAFVPPAAPLPDLHSRARRLLVETDDSVRTSTEELRFAAARPGRTTTAPPGNAPPDHTETDPPGPKAEDHTTSPEAAPADHDAPRPHPDHPPADTDPAEPRPDHPDTKAWPDRTDAAPPPSGPTANAAHPEGPEKPTEAEPTGTVPEEPAEPTPHGPAGGPPEGAPDAPSEESAEAHSTRSAEAHRDGAADTYPEKSAGRRPGAAGEVPPVGSIALDPAQPFAETPAVRDAVAPFVEALADARGELGAAFRAGLRLDEGHGEPAADEERALLEEILTRCTTAQRRLDTATPAFDQLRALERDITPALEHAETRFRELTGRTATAASTLVTLRDEYAPAVSLPVTGHVEQAKDRLVFATTELNRARQAAYPGDLGTAAVHLRAAEGAIDQADLFVGGVERLAAELAEASATAAAEQGSPSADPLDALRDRGDWLLPARSAVAAAADFVTTHRGAVGAPARTRLSEAERHLTDGQPQRAHALAQEARRLAEQDVRAYGNPYGGPVGDGLAGALLGGIILGEPPDGTGRADLRGPACFGGTATRARRTAGGQF